MAEYYAAIYDILVNSLKAEEVCKLFGLCGAPGIKGKVHFKYLHIDLGCGWWHSWLPCSTSWKVTGAIPDAVMGDLSLTNLPSHYSPVVNSPPNRNECQGCLLGVKVAGVWD